MLNSLTSEELQFHIRNFFHLVIEFPSFENFISLSGIMCSETVAFTIYNGPFLIYKMAASVAGRKYRTFAAFGAIRRAAK